MNNQHGDEPLKHVKRPSESRSEMHRHSSRSHSEPTRTPRRTRTQQDTSFSEQANGNKNSTKIWASLIILAILIIALVPIINTQMHKSKDNLAEKTVQTSSSKSKKKVKSVSEKPAKKAKKVKKENKKEENKSSATIKSTPQSKEDDVQQSTDATSQSTVAPATSTTDNATPGSNYNDSSQSVQYSAPSTYQVQNGDSLYKIAAENGTSIENLKKINGLTDDVVNPGQSIKLN